MVVESLLSLVVISSLSVLLGLSYRGGRGSGDGGGGDGGGAAAADELGCSSMLYAGMHCLLLLLHIHASFSAVTHFPHIQTHIHTHTYTHLSTDHAAFTSEKIISVVTHSTLLHDAHIHRWSDITCTIKTRPLRKGSFAPPGTVSPPTPGPRSRDRTCPDSRLPRNPQQPTAPPSEPNHVHIIEPVPLRPSCADFGVESGFGVWGQDPNTCCRSKATEA